MEEELREHFGDLLDEDTLELLVRYARGEKVNLEESFRVEGVVVGVGDVLKIRRGDDVYEVPLECCKDMFELGYLVRVKSKVVRSERDFEVVGDVSRTVQGIFLGKNGSRFALAVGNSVWICVGNVECDRGDLIEVKGFNQGEKFFVLGYRNLGKADVGEMWTKVRNVIPLKLVNLRGRVSGLSGEKIVRGKKMAIIHISDDSGRIRVFLLGDNASLYKYLDVGDWIELYNCYARIGYDGEIEVVCDDGLAIKVF
ncbi:OB-fold nucleic acid binding domain-containing protein [Archaeoglobus profundus]|uniref:Nucleic acid binding OB-fold tRNA/helicase-type n=1 Tax=Archaeoglobus profundus (strain DSM 5631 / JCM 9629 / NBRC 100127 / Av18) TaxID=572546 RepID=D2RDU8_ARCPA|nr:OB-fold nucleic acid binding domain-containing protein [Archaeoglobus profundus]ADB58292.1 nucleic acid binding OB-fold tRNA/helicase-type [Archaeoglobus profundus DSM 5631]